MSVLRIS